MPTEEKVRTLQELKINISKYKTVCIVDMMKMPTKQVQQIKRTLGDKVLIKVSKKSLIKMAMKNSGKDLIEHLSDQPGLVFTNLGSFELFKEINSLRYKTYAKEGYIADDDVEVHPGPTDLLPGPVISELQKVGITAGVETGKIAIKRTSKILKKGQLVSKELASVLRKLKLQIAEIRLPVNVIYDGDLYRRDVLELVEFYPQKLKETFNEALNLSIYISYPTKENIKYLLLKAYQRGKVLEVKLGEI